MVDDEKDPLTFSDPGKDPAKKDERAVREEERQSIEKLKDMGVKPPMPDSIELKHGIPAAVEVIESGFKSLYRAVVEKVKQIKEDSKKKP